jgi:hypothetical protein
MTAVTIAMMAVTSARMTGTPGRTCAGRIDPDRPAFGPATANGLHAKRKFPKAINLNFPYRAVDAILGSAKN